MAAHEVTVRLSAGAVAAAEIVLGVRLAADGEHVLVSVSPRPAAAPRAAGVCALTRRERQVLELLSGGANHAGVARELQISPETARTHAKHVYRKLGVSSRGELLGVEL
jgi:DNA-binding NarL/FixJ family response regulator